jgi:hypothetical protein
MAYNFLVHAIKNRIITELREFFSSHPHFNKLEVVNKFPYEERIQQGIIVRNTSAGRMPLSADNFQGNVFSYVTLANHDKSKSLSIDWVREDTNHLAEWITREDYSHQFNNFPQHNRTIILNNEMLNSRSDLDATQNIRSIEVFINNQKVIPKSVDGNKKQIILPYAPGTNSKVEVSYWSRNMALPGIYQIEIISGNEEIKEYDFLIDALLDREEVIFENSTGDETTYILNNHQPIFNGSLKIRENDNLLDEGKDYVIDYNSGIVTFLQSPTLLRGSKVVARYRVKGLTTGPFKIKSSYQALNTALPGVVIAFGNAVSVGDKHFIVINRTREITALEYSGKWEMTISLDIFAKDSFKIEEIIDITTSALLFYKKEQLDSEGIALVDVSFGGESEQIFDEATGDLYYNGSVDYQFLTEWILQKPLLRTLEGFNLEILSIEESENLIPVNLLDRNIERIK